MPAAGEPAPSVSAAVRVLMHLSDTRFGTEQPEVADALVRLALSERPQVVVASGDITQSAQPEEFDAARRFFARLVAPTLLVLPGEHDLPLWDLPQRLLMPYVRLRRAFATEAEPRLHTPELRLVCINTTRRWRRHCGSISAAQIERSARWLQEGPASALRVVVTHHPVAVPDPRDEPHLLRHAAAALQRWAGAGVHLVLGGHLLRPCFLRPDRALHTHGIWVGLAGTALSKTLPQQTLHSVQLLRHQGHTSWRLERWNHDPARQTFGLDDWIEIRAGLTLP